MPELKDLTDEELAQKRNCNKEDLAAANREVTELKAIKDEIDTEWLRRFDARGATACKTGEFNTYISERDGYVEIDDLELLEAYINEGDRLYLLETRPRAKAIREAMAAGEIVPGISIHKRRTINQRRL